MAVACAVAAAAATVVTADAPAADAAVVIAPRSTLLDAPWRRSGVWHGRMYHVLTRVYRLPLYGELPLAWTKLVSFGCNSSMWPNATTLEWAQLRHSMPEAGTVL